VSVLGTPFASSFEANEIELIKSEITPEGATHTLVATQDLL
jgi:2'-5' RNA ligase